MPTHRSPSRSSVIDRTESLERPVPERRTLDREPGVRHANAPESVPERADPEHAVAVEQKPVSRRLEVMRRWTRGTQPAKSCGNVSRPDVAGAVFSESPDMLVRNETEVRRPCDLLEDTPTRSGPQGPVPADKDIADLPRPALPGKGDPAPSLFFPGVKVPVDDGPQPALAVLHHCADGVEPLETGVVALELAVTDSADAGRAGPPNPQSAATGDRQRLDRSGDGCVAQAVPRKKPPSIEAQEAGIRADPQIPIVGLRDRVHRAERPSCPLAPGCERVAGENSVRGGRDSGQGRAHEKT